MPIRLPNATLVPSVNTQQSLAEIRDDLLDEIYRATKELDTPLTADVQSAIRRIKQSKYNLRVIRNEIKRLGANHESNLRTVLAEQIEFGAKAGVEYSRLAGEAAIALRRNVRNIIATEAMIARERKMISNAPADKLLRDLIPRPVNQTRKLSKALHSDQVVANRKIYREVRAAIRDSKHMAKATSDLIHAARTHTTELASADKLAKPLKRVQKAGNSLYARGDTAALKKWRQALRGLKRYTERLAKDGRMRPTLLEALSKLEKAGPKQLEDVIQHWAADKQRYAAERIIRTEQQIAFKEAQIAGDSKNKAIVGYIWRMNRAARSGFVKRTKLPRKKSKRLGARRRCICEILDGQQISVDEARRRPIGHPHCMCSLIPVYGPGSLVSVTESELAEFS